MTKSLDVLLGGRIIGRVEQSGPTLEFTYDEKYRQSPNATPLSLSMPLVTARHTDPVLPYLWGLLPDNPEVLDRWAKRYQVSARNPFALLTHVGENCAGAVQFVPPEQVARAGLEGGAPWLSDDEVGQRLRALRDDPTTWLPDAAGRFSPVGSTGQDRPAPGIRIAGAFPWGGRRRPTSSNPPSPASTTTIWTNICACALPASSACPSQRATCVRSAASGSWGWSGTTASGKPARGGACIRRMPTRPWAYCRHPSTRTREGPPRPRSSRFFAIECPAAIPRRTSRGSSTPCC